MGSTPVENSLAEDLAFAEQRLGGPRTVSANGSTLLPVKSSDATAITPRAACESIGDFADTLRHAFGGGGNGSGAGSNMLDMSVKVDNDKVPLNGSGAAATTVQFNVTTSPPNAVWC